MATYRAYLRRQRQIDEGLLFQVPVTPSRSAYRRSINGNRASRIRQAVVHSIPIEDADQLHRPREIGPLIRDWFNLPVEQYYHLGCLVLLVLVLTSAWWVATQM